MLKLTMKISYKAPFLADNRHSRADQQKNKPPPNG